jgi:hypothetical protein
MAVNSPWVRSKDKLHMSLSLAEALRHVDLDLRVGHSYRCEVQGKLVELRVVDQVPATASRIDESDVMLDPWVELPPPQADLRICVRVRPDARLPVDVPEIPQYEELP